MMKFMGDVPIFRPNEFSALQALRSFEFGLLKIWSNDFRTYDFQP